MKKRLYLAFTLLSLIVLSLTLTTAHDLYYDNHHHIKTDELDDYWYKSDNYYKKYNYDSYYKKDIYYSDYDNKYYVSDYKYKKTYYNKPIVYSRQYQRDFGHDEQLVRFRIYPYRSDRYYNDCDDYYDNDCDYPRKKYTKTRYHVNDYYGYEKKVVNGIVYYKPYNDPVILN